MTEAHQRRRNAKMSWNMQYGTLGQSNKVHKPKMRN